MKIQNQPKTNHEFDILPLNHLGDVALAFLTGLILHHFGSSSHFLFESMEGGHERFLRIINYVIYIH
jgi:hypothetical protein